MPLPGPLQQPPLSLCVCVLKRLYMPEQDNSDCVCVLKKEASIVCMRVYMGVLLRPCNEKNIDCFVCVCVRETVTIQDCMRVTSHVYKCTHSTTTYPNPPGTAFKAVRSCSPNGNTTVTDFTLTVSTSLFMILFTSKD